MESPIAFTSFEKWNSLAAVTLQHPFRPERIRCGAGHLVVDPAIAVHEDVAVLSSDWIPVHSDGTATFERMVHSPGLYLHKARAVRERGKAYVSASQAEIEVRDPLVLVGGAPNYYHWLADYLPRVLVADLFPEFSRWRLFSKSRWTCSASATPAGCALSLASRCAHPGCWCPH